jgi:cysteinyl-tRNA synthetase, unknown class
LETFLLIVMAVAALALAAIRQNKASAAKQSKSAGSSNSAPQSGRQPRESSSDTDEVVMPKPKARQSKAANPPLVPEANPTGRQRSAVGKGLFANVRSWGYQLQKVKINDVANSPFDMMVVDYSKDGSHEAAFTPEEIARMRAKPDGSTRLVISYMSIGEAEDYRYYWNPEWAKTKPDWLLDENPEWKGNYPVCFWDTEWQGVFYGNPDAYMDRIIDAGFDGVYLDKCDVFEDLKDRNRKVAATRRDLEGDMISFISRLYYYAKARNPNFAVIMQNAEILLEQESLREVIDGVAKESLLYGLPGPEKPNPKDEVVFAKQALDLALNADRTVFVVEYLNADDKVRSALQTVDGYGYIGTVSPKNRDLAALNTNPNLA